MTIEERAKEYMHGDIDSHPVRVAMYDAYVDGATDQREIDMKKAREYVYKILDRFFGAGMVDTLYEEFCEYMEED